MLNLPDSDALRAVLDQPLNEDLKSLLRDRLADTIACGLQELTHVLVIEAEDTEADVITAIGFSPLVSRIDRERGQPDWDWMEHHGEWWELIYTVGNAGFAYILLVEDDPRSPFAQLCNKEARR